MACKSFVLLVVGTVIFFICSFSSADVPHMINYQGKLTTASGGCLNDTVQMRFSIYPDTLGSPAVWTETQNNVIVKEGIFNVLLGIVDSIPAVVFDGGVKYLGVKVETDPEMRPLKPMVSVVYAYKSLEADTADYARAGAGGGADNDWVFRITDTADTTLITGGAWGIARYGNVLYGNFDSTHVNLGVACTTGLSGGYNLKYCTVGGGMGNTAKGDNATVGGGYSNMAYGSSATVAGGYRNMAHSDDATIGGGVYNTAGYVATVPGGYTNAAEGPYSFVGGGGENAATDWYATVPGGFGDTAAGLYSFAAGAYVRLTSTADYTFAFGNNFTTSASHAVIFHDADTPIKVGIGTTSPTERLDVAGTAQMIGFKMPTSASDGYVLTSNGDGVGTWQEAAAGADTDWVISGSNMYSGVSGNVGIGTTSPSGKLHVQSPDLYSGYFTADSLSGATHVIHSEFTGGGTGVSPAAVYGKSVPADYYGYGGYFEGGHMGVFGKVSPTGSNDYCGVYGYVSGGSGTNYGLRGYASGSAIFVPQYGVYGHADGISGQYGVYGLATGSGTKYGVYGYASGLGTNYAGYFDGDVTVTGTLSKGAGSFQIDHPLDPENKYLFHSFVESPDMMNVYNGNVVLDGKGEAWVELPDWFEALNRDFRYQLTSIGEPGPNLYVAEEISGNRFKIAGGKAGMKVSWQVTGIRQDAFAEKNRIPVEEEKTGDERGKYLHPEAYDLPETMGINYTDKKEKGD